MKDKPSIALAIGDPAGISPELTAKVIALPEVRDAASLIVIGDRRVFDEGARIANTNVALDIVHEADRVPTGDRVAFMDLAHIDASSIARGVASAAGGR